MAQKKKQPRKKKAAKAPTKKVHLRSRQKIQKVVDDITEKKMSQYEAMRAAGYSHSTARNPKKNLWALKSAQDAWEKVHKTIDFDQIIENIRIGLTAEKVQFVGQFGRPEITIDIEQRRRMMEFIREMEGLTKTGVNIERAVINFIDDTD